MFRKSNSDAPVKTGGGFISKLSRSGRELWTRQFGDKSVSSIALSEKLLSLRGEASSVLIADELIARLSRMDDAEFLEFMQVLLADFQPNEDHLKSIAEQYINKPGPDTAYELSKASEAKRQGVFRMISTSPRGPMALLEIRKRLIGLLKIHPDLKPIDGGLLYLFRSWYSRGFLELRRIDWTTPANILEKLIAYEAVHAIKGWPDLRRRLADDRRCYAFFHPALKDEPLIFVEVALLPEMASNISDVIDQDMSAPTEDPNTAIFYSISNCQPGLKGVSFGNFLIKQVVKKLQADFPSLETFATLSPVPGFSKWIADNDEVLHAHDVDDRMLCAHYLIDAKRGTLPLDPVARFHLGNGAKLARINSGGDMSERGIAQSRGILVNYVYDMSELENNHEALVNSGVVATTPAITKLAAKAGLKTSSQ